MAGYAARRELAPERETVLRQEAVRTASEQKAAEQAQAIDAGKAGFRARYEARKAEQAATKERETQARGLVRAWDLALDAYGKALPGLEADATLGGTRERVEQLGRAMRQQPGVVQILRERGAEFGLGDRPRLAEVVSSARPERAVDAMLQRAEVGMRAHLDLQRQAELEAARVAQEAARKLEQEQQARSRPRQGQGRGMSH